jgi:hypothetical protein
MKRLLAATLVMFVLAAIPAGAQQFPPIGDDNTSSLGSFKIQITNQFAGMFAGCPGFNNPILSSPTMYDPATKIGRSSALLDGSAADTNGVPVGTAGTVVSEGMLIPPPGYPCAGAPAGCLSGANTREIHTEVRSLKMVNLGGALPVVRAGVWYDSSTVQTNPPSKISPGEVESQSGPGGAAANDLPGSSFFDIFVRVDMPACGTFPGATLYNAMPLIVKNPNLTALPPRVVYLHDTSSIVPILFLNANPPLWNQGDILGYFVLAGHGVGFTNSQSDVSEFNNFMSSQTFTCVTTSNTTSTSASRTKGEMVTTPIDHLGGGPGGGGPSPTPTPAPTPTPNPCG